MNADTMQGTSDPGETHPDAPTAGAITPTESATFPVPPEPDLHETLLQGVSADALTIGEPAAAEAPSTEPEADAASLAEDLTVVPEEATAPVSDATETVEAPQAAAETVAQAVPETIIATVAETVPDAIAKSVPVTVPALPDLRALMDFPKAPRITAMMGEFGEVNATVLTYLRGEGAAALAHWQALSGARTPADALRLQVDEMQRAANASLSCFAAIAQRASRFTGTMGRP